MHILSYKTFARQQFNITSFIILISNVNQRLHNMIAMFTIYA